MARVRAILAVSAAGLALTLASAWAGLLWDPPGTALGLVIEPSGDKIWDLEQSARPGVRTIRYWHMQISGQSLWIPTADYQARKFDLSTLPPHLRPASLDDLHVMAWYTRVGFPFPALHGAIHWGTQINSLVTYTAENAVLLAERSNGEPVALPLRPLWPGFLANVLLWSAACWVAGLGVRKLRVRRRARRGLCPACRYPRAGLAEEAPCPECGRSPAPSGPHSLTGNRRRIQSGSSRNPRG